MIQYIYAVEPGRTEQKVQTQALFIALGLFLVKIVAYGITSSNAILTDTLESLVNVSAATFGLYSLRLSARPKDKNHPYGHGKIEFVSAGIEGTLILVAGIAIWVKSLYNFWHPTSIEQLDIGLVLVAVAGAVNYAFGKRLVRQGKQRFSPVLESGGRHLLADAWSSVGLLVGLGLLLLTGWQWIDNVLALGFGSLILYSGWKIVRKSLAGIMDEADFELLERVVEILDRDKKDNWVDIHNLRVQKYGSRLHIDAHLTLPWYYNIQRMHDEVEAVDDLVNASFSGRVELFIHVDPCIPHSCRICPLQECQVRKHEFEKRVNWNLENVVKNQKHYLESVDL